MREKKMAHSIQLPGCTPHKTFRKKKSNPLLMPELEM